MATKFEQFTKNEDLIALCICTMNRPDELNCCLESVFASKDRPDRIIVSDDSHNGQPTQSIVSKYPTVIYQEGPHRGLGPNRNACIRRAKSSHLIFIDDDVRVPPEFFVTVRQIIAASDSKTIITGYEMNYGGGGRWTGEVRKIIPHNPDFWGFQKVPVSNDYGAIIINATIFPRCLFEQALFDEHLRYGSEEIDMAQHALALGYCIVYKDDLFVEHHPSLVNRERYEQFIHASRMYATAKSYWQYERSPLKTIAYVLLAPLHMAGNAVCRRNLSALFNTFHSTVLASRYILASLTRAALVPTTVSRGESSLNH